jgi:hypothetical protein
MITHTILEILYVCGNLIIFAAAAVYSEVTNRREFGWLAATALTIAVFDLLHTFLTMLNPSDLEFFVPATWFYARLLEPLFFLGVYLNPVKLQNKTVYSISLVSVITVATYFISGEYYHIIDIFGFKIGRIFELIPLLESLAVVAYIAQDRHKNGVLWRFLTAKMMLNIATHAIMLNSTALYDASFQAAHMVKLISVIPVAMMLHRIHKRIVE